MKSKKHPIWGDMTYECSTCGKEHSEAISCPVWKKQQAIQGTKDTVGKIERVCITVEYDRTAPSREYAEYLSSYLLDGWEVDRADTCNFGTTYILKREKNL